MAQRKRPQSNHAPDTERLPTPAIGRKDHEVGRHRISNTTGDPPGPPSPENKASFDRQVEILKYAVLLKSQPVSIWRLYRAYRTNEMPIPTEVLLALDRMAEHADTGMAATRSNHVEHRAIALLTYIDQIEDGKRPTQALEQAYQASGISVNAIKTLASRLHIRTRPYRIRPRNFDTGVLRNANDPFGLTESKNLGKDHHQRKVK